MARHVVLIGPVAVGKTTVGIRLAHLLGMPFVDLDEVAAEYYAEVGQGVDTLIDQAKSKGLVAAHRWWQPARLHAVQRVIDRSTHSVIAFGAGHSHYEEELWFGELVPLLTDAFVVLLLPEVDDEDSIKILRTRCIAERGVDHGWLFDDTDFIHDWVVSSHNRSLADAVVIAAGRTLDEVAYEIFCLVRE